MSTRRLLLALSNNSPFPLLLNVQYYSNLGGYLYIPDGQHEGYEEGSIFNFIKYYMNNYANDETNCILQYGDFTLYWDNNGAVYIDKAYFDDGNIGITGHDESDNIYYGIIYNDYGTTTLNGTTYNYCPGQIYVQKIQ